MRIFIMGLLFSAVSVQTVAQSHIYLSIIGKQGWRVRFFKNDRIKFKMDKSDQYSFGVIQGFTDSTFVVSDTHIKIKEVEIINIKGKSTSTWNFHSLPDKIIIAGVAYPLIAVANSRGKLNQGPAIAGGAMIAAGFLGKLFIGTDFKVGDKRRATIIYKPEEDLKILKQERNNVKLR